MQTPSVIMSRIQTWAVLLGVASVALSGCSPRESASPAAERPPQEEAASESEGPQLLNPVEFQAALTEEDAIVINVCTSPKSGELAGTDMAIAYNELEGAADRLPSDKSTRIIVYCISGGMSKDATETLTAMGYTTVIDLKGGTKAWRKAGLPIGERTQ